MWVGPKPDSSSSTSSSRSPCTRCRSRAPICARLARLSRALRGRHHRPHEGAAPERGESHRPSHRPEPAHRVGRPPTSPKRSSSKVGASPNSSCTRACCWRTRSHWQRLFTDLTLRTAARAAVDGSALADSIFGGYADPARGLFGPAVSWAADKRAEVTGRAKAATTAQVMSKTKDKVPRLAAYTNRAELPEVATVQQQLEKAGFTVKRTSASTRRWSPTSSPAGTTPSSCPGWCSSTPASRSPTWPATSRAAACTTSPA